jgi:hypothetical protein
LSVKIGWVEVRNKASHSTRGQGKMLCGAKLSKGGPTVVQATLAFAVRPLTVALKQADLIVKQ